MNEPIYEVRNLSKEFRRVGQRRGKLAVDRVDLTIRKGEAFGLVGESGSGKTTLGRMMGKLLLPTGGSLMFRGQEIAGIQPYQARPLRQHLQMVFQQSSEFLDPKLTLRSILEEPYRIHFRLGAKERAQRVADLMEQVGLDPGEQHKTIGEISGGQKQRIGIARAISVSPDFVILDEPVSALDVSIQGQIINLLMELKSRYGFTFLLISHDLNVVRHMCDSVAVMKDGRIVETGTAEQVLGSPRETYTRQLVKAFNLVR